MSHWGGDEFKRGDLGRARGREGRVRGEGEGADIVGEGESGRDQGERGCVDACLQEGCGGRGSTGAQREETCVSV